VAGGERTEERRNEKSGTSGGEGSRKSNFFQNGPTCTSAGLLCGWQTGTTLQCVLLCGYNGIFLNPLIAFYLGQRE
jgi:hypothetical protein